MGQVLRFEARGKVKVIANEELEIIPLKKGERQGFQNKKWCKS